MRSLGLASLLTLLSLPSIARADASLTLDLPPSRAQATSTLSASNEPTSSMPSAGVSAAGNVATQSQRTPDRRGGLRRGGKERVVGRLGVAARTTSIRRSPGSHKRVLARVPAGTYLALTDTRSGWYGVLMADHSTGWIPQKEVKVLDYEVVAPDTSQPYANYGAASSPLLSSGQQSILATAYTYLGVPYRYGGTSPSGMDCSAFVQKCFAALGLRLPRTAREQIHYGVPIRPEELQAADRVYFASRDGRITHTGIYIGDGYFIHASRSRGGVAVSRLTEPMYRRMFAGARR